MKNSKISEYEKLLNKKEEIEKESFHIQTEYMRKFGNLLVEEYELQVESIKYKKMISFCTKKINNGLQISENELNEYIENVMDAYNTELQNLTSFAKYASEKKKAITDNDALRIKNIYRMIVHMIHPDLHPELQENKEIPDLWNKAVDSYKRNDLKQLISVYDKLIIALNKESDISIENISLKIKEIADEIDFIRSNEPYTFHRIIRSKKKTDELINRLKCSIESYKNYVKELKKKMKEFNIIHKYEA